MVQIIWSGSFWTQFRVSRDLFTNLTAVCVCVAGGGGFARFELSHRGNLQQPVEFKIVRT